MSAMPFLSTCRGDPAAPAAQDRTPLYVSTDETDLGRGVVEPSLRYDLPPVPPELSLSTNQGP